MSSIAKTLHFGKALSYTSANLMNTVATILILPTLAAVSAPLGVVGAKALFASQIATVLATYSFPIVTPRTLAGESAARAARLLRGILSYQLAVILAAGLFVVHLTPTTSCALLVALSTYAFGVGPVLQWQWYHLSRPSSGLQLKLLVGSRLLLLGAELVRTIDTPTIARCWPFVPTLALISLLPAWPTLCAAFGARPDATADSDTKTPPSLLREFKAGVHLFTASLLSSIYLLGPSALTSIAAPARLVEVQQFDRLRNALSNMVSMALSTAYPLLIGKTHAELYGRLSKALRMLIGPSLAVALVLIGLGLANVFPASGLAAAMHTSLRALAFALACGLAACASNYVSLTFLHPLSNDHRYQLAIIYGAIGFVLLAGGLFLFRVESMPDGAMAAAALAEITVLLALLKTARDVSREYGARGAS